MNVCMVELRIITIVLHFDRMLAKSNPDGRGGMDQTGHPVIRTLYDHLEVNTFE